MNGIEFYDWAIETYHSLNGKAPSNSEAVYRTLISRLYYSAFLIARDKAGITTKADVHKDVLDHWKSRKPALYNRLRDLKRERGIADYQLDKTVGLRKVRLSMNLAKKAIEDI